MRNEQVVVNSAVHKKSAVKLTDEFLSAAEKSLKNYRETGLHSTMDELFTWLDSWDTAKQLKAPKCHK